MCVGLKFKSLILDPHFMVRSSAIGILTLGAIFVLEERLSLSWCAGIMLSRTVETTCLPDHSISGFQTHGGSVLKYPQKRGRAQNTSCM